MGALPRKDIKGSLQMGWGDRGLLQQRWDCEALQQPVGELIKTKQAGESAGSGVHLSAAAFPPLRWGCSAFHFPAPAEAAASLPSWAEMC